MNTRKLFLYCFGIVLVFVAGISFLFPLIYDTSDDTMMLITASGYLTGKPDPHLVFINILIGYLLTFLYNTISYIEWYTLHLILCQIISFTVILFVFYQRYGYNKLNIHLASFSVLAVGLLFLTRLQFTTTAFVLYAAGLLLLYRNLSDQAKPFSKSSILAYSLLCWSFMLRIDVFLVSSVVAAIFFLPFLKTKSFIISSSIILSLCSIAFLFQYLAYHSSDEWAYFSEFNIYRAKLNIADNPHVDQIDYQAISKENPKITDLHVRMFTKELVLTEPINLEQLKMMKKHLKPRSILDFNVSELKELLLKYKNEWVFISLMIIVSLLSSSFLNFISILVFISICFAISLNMIVKPRVFYGLFFLLVCFLNFMIAEKKIKYIYLMPLFFSFFILYFSRVHAISLSSNIELHKEAERKINYIEKDDICLFRGSFKVHHINPFRTTALLKTKKILFGFWFMTSPLYREQVKKIFNLKNADSQKLDYIFENVLPDYSGNIISLGEQSNDMLEFLKKQGILMKEYKKNPDLTVYSFQKQ